MSGGSDEQMEAIYRAQQKGVRIIKRGRPPAERLFEVTCRCCRSEIEFVRGAARTSRDQRDGDFLFIDCPVCLATITVAP